jgi:1-deoxy-D-xylulose-5-phosphate reductoisomerase
MTRKKISILGSTGSIGRQVLNICREFPDRFTVSALAAGKNLDLLHQQAEEFQPKLVSVAEEESVNVLNSLFSNWKPEIAYGVDGAINVSIMPDTDVVVSSMVGAAGLVPTYHALLQGKTVALANKETLVMAGELIMELVKADSLSLMPVDSEHSAIFQCLEGNDRRSVKRLILTASGGPFLHHDISQLHDVTVEEALNHPRWNMGKKITIDSATLMNKGLEVIEAHWLFDVPPEKIDIVIHPESIIHSMVEYIDGSVIAQLGVTDMKLPILYALSYPERWDHKHETLDFIEQKKLSFIQLEEKKVPCVRLAYQALQSGGIMPAALNAANEIAVQAFLDKKMKFLEIPAVIDRVLQKTENFMPHTPDEIVDGDRTARTLTEQLIKNLNR